MGYIPGCIMPGYCIPMPGIPPIIGCCIGIPIPGIIIEELLLVVVVVVEELKEEPPMGIIPPIIGGCIPMPIGGIIPGMPPIIGCYIPIIGYYIPPIIGFIPGIIPGCCIPMPPPIIMGFWNIGAIDY